MFQKLIWLGLMLSISHLCAQEPARIIVDTEGEVHPWSSLEVNNAPESFQFAIVTDRTGGHRPGIFPTAIEKLNLLQPEFVMSVGDLIEGYTTNVERIDEEWEEFTGFIDQLSVPFFYVPGNHDYINEVMAEEWKKRFGKDYYHFVYQDVLFLCLNSEERMRGAGRGYIDEPQLAYIEKTLAENPDVKWTMVFLHQPLWDQEDPGEWPAVEAALQGRPHTVFAGHRHRYVKYERNDNKYFVLATTGGGSSLRGTRFGEFDHVVWVTMTADGPIIANLLLDGIWDENVNTEQAMAFSRPLIETQAMRVEPLYLTDEGAAPKQMELRLQNPSDVPMAYEIDYRASQDLWIKATPLRDTLPPNQTLTRSLPLHVEATQGQLHPLTVHAKVTYLPEGQPELEIHQRLHLRPEPQLALEQRDISVDGNLDEWGPLRFDSEHADLEADPFSHDGEADASFAWDATFDEEYLYLGAHFSDDELEVSDGTAPWNQDGAALLIDARPTRISAYNDGDDGFRAYLPLLISPAEEPGEAPNVYYQDRLPEGTEIVCVRTEEGFAIEAAVPVSYLKQMQNGDWETVRLNVIQQDHDDEGVHVSRLMWQPDWRSEARTVGTGIFVKNE